MQNVQVLLSKDVYLPRPNLLSDPSCQRFLAMLLLQFVLVHRLCMSLHTQSRCLSVD